jgi:hypothetical protein
MVLITKAKKLIPNFGIKKDKSLISLKAIRKLEAAKKLQRETGKPVMVTFMIKEGRVRW